MSTVLDRTESPSGVDETPGEVHVFCECNPGRDLCGRIPPPGAKVLGMAPDTTCAMCAHITEVEQRCPYCDRFIL